MASEDEENTCPTNPVALSMLSKLALFILFRKKINTKTSSAENQVETQDIQLSSYSFQPLKRKTRKVMYKITNEKEITSFGNKKIRHDSSTHASRSMPSQKATIVTSERIHSGPSKTTRGKKKKSTRETASSRNIGSPLNPVGIFSNLRFFFYC
ncbi:hypothetical protein C2G38_273425 [Gigaspora rosea]|uniref:Uncharacterized protein n=1 Tax=Gigaspora rosea TaxID=44941 RepID=A0A397UJU9_9GLOM|nr:hypothetical protein C2G38_273425 [Gigaspora rosea]